jgi:hypothetical protein
MDANAISALLAQLRAAMVTGWRKHVLTQLPPAAQLQLKDVSDDVVLLTAAAALFGFASLAAALFALCSRKPKLTVIPRREFDAEGKEHMPRDVLVCTACNLMLPLDANQRSVSEAVGKHRMGKRHRKVCDEKQVADDEHALFTWDRAVKWEKSISRDADEQGDDGVRSGHDPLF